MTTTVILYGPPAAGKDTVTQELIACDPTFVPFRRLKVGNGRADGYRMTTIAALSTLQEQGQILWLNDRYGATYAVDRPGLDQVLAGGHWPVVHVGQIEAVHALRGSSIDTTWAAVSLWCPRTIAAQRLIGRGSTDIDARLAAWDETRPLEGADLTIDTAATTAAAAARSIALLARQRAGSAEHRV